MLLQQLAQHPKQGDEVTAPRPAMNEGMERRPIPIWIEIAHEPRGRGAQNTTEGLDRRNDRRDAAERDGSGNVGDDLAIIDARVPPHDLNGIEGGVRGVERRVEVVERGFH